MKTHSIRYRKSNAKTFKTAIHWIGLMIVVVFLLWAAAMVIWQAIQK